MSKVYKIIAVLKEKSFAAFILFPALSKLGHHFHKSIKESQKPFIELLIKKPTHVYNLIITSFGNYQFTAVFTYIHLRA